MKNFIDWSKIMLLITFPTAVLLWLAVKIVNKDKEDTLRKNRNLKAQNNRRADEILKGVYSEME